METTGQALVDHWSWAADKGVMNRNTAAGLRAACAQVLSVLDDWQHVDVAALDIEQTLSRFQNLKKKDFKPSVLEAYKRRFRNAVASYLEYLADPAGWKPRTVERTSSPASEGPRRPMVTVSSGASELNATSLVEYPFPIREGVMARLILPRDLKASEVKRIGAFMTSLLSGEE